MKKYFYIAIAIILMAACAIVVYGAWLNYSDESQIAKRMDNRTLHLTGAVAKEREIQAVMKLPAVRFTSNKMVDATALTDGRILQWQVQKNSAVRKGDVLLTMANEQIPLRLQQAISAVRKAEAALAQANSSYQRQGRLIQKNATSREKYEESQAQYLAAQEALREAEAQRDQCEVQVSWLTVKAPVDGEVLLIYKPEGTYVQGGTPLALVGDFDLLTFSLSLTDENARHLQVGRVSTLKFQDRWSVGKAYDTEYGKGNQGWRQEVNATLKDIVPPLSEPADMRRGVWEVDNRTRILEPMTYTDVTMQLGDGRRCLSIPLRAMFDRQHDRVLVVDEEGILHLRTVVTGTDDDKNIEILEGISPGEVVIVGDHRGLSEGMKVEVTLEEEDR